MDSDPNRTVSSSELPRPRLLDQMRSAIRVRHYSRRTEQAYVHWTKRFIYFHNKRHPVTMGEREVTEFLNHLAVRRQTAHFLPWPAVGCNE
jgi:hypothetical protein